LGFTKIDYANISKFFGIFLMIFGSLIGGIMVHHFGLFQAMVMSVSLQAIAGLLFLIQSLVGNNLSVLIITVGVESFTSGIVSTLFISYLSSFCHGSFSGSNFTALYSFGSLCRIIISAVSGWIADVFGWNFLFICVSLSFFPTLWCIVKIRKSYPQKFK
jgi:PAT family beta-lactamase induction signal transducer AmpG